MRCKGFERHRISYRKRTSNRVQLRAYRLRSRVRRALMPHELAVYLQKVDPQGL